MGERLVCPRCGESKNVELVPFLDDEGRAKVQLTCRLIVHEEPVVVEYDDPTVPRGSALAPADGLVHDLDLYAKLEGVVLALERPAEYGVVEDRFAREYPDDYVTLWRRYGHVATHGMKRYTVSAYLSRLLGTLSRHGSIEYLPSRGTGCWSYNADISAWANPRRSDGPVQSWVEFAREQGWDPEGWPAVQLLPEEEVAQAFAAEAYWIYDNHVHRYSRLHRADCSYCNDGQGFHDESSDVAGEWLGPYEEYDDAVAVAQRTRHEVSTCKNCTPDQ